MHGAASVICPGCRSEFLVPGPAAEALCPGCDAHIVWRRCLSTGQAFPVLARWPTWVHPGCPEVHAVDLRVAVPASPAGADRPPRSLVDDLRADATVLGDAVCADGGLTGRLYLDHAVLGVWPDGGQPVVVSPLATIRSATITEPGARAAARRSRWRRRRPAGSPDRCRLTLQLPGADVPIDIAMDAAALREALRPHLPVA